MAYKAKIDGKWYVIAGKEKAGPYDDCKSLKFSPDGKTLAYSILKDYKWFKMILFDGKEYIGSIVKDKIVYISGSNIIIK